jgi:2-dehydropantoate 2-reductase
MHRPPVIDAHDVDGRFDVILVPVRCDQLDSTLPVLEALSRGDVLFFGNTVGRVSDLVAALGPRALFGFPAAGGVRDEELVRYVTIRQQRTMVGESTGEISFRVRELARELRKAGFPTRVRRDPAAWLVAHAAFIVPITCALRRANVDPRRLAADRQTLQLMVRAARQAFRVLRAAGNREIFGNLRARYLALPEAVAVTYWRHVLAGPNGELWFAAHARAAPEEMRTLGQALLAEIDGELPRAPALTELVAD